MNILYINHYAGSPEMGMEFRPYDFARRWVQKGHSVTVLAGDYSHLRVKNPSVKRDLEETLIDGINYCWIKTGEYSSNGVKRALSMFRFVYKTMKYARKLSEYYHPDVVIASSTYPLDTYAAQRIRRISGAKYIHEVHDMWPSTLYEVGGMPKWHPFVRIIQIAENAAYRTCDSLVSLAPYTKSYMVEHGLRPHKFNNIQNGVNEEYWENLKEIPAEHNKVFNSLKNKFIVGYFGGHARSNSLDTLLDVAKSIEEKDIVFVLVGKGMEKQRLIARVEDERIENVFFLPPVEKQAVPDLLTHFDCSYIGGAASPLYRFGLCVNKMYDSMMSALPIVCAITAPKTLVEEYRCGLMANPNSTEDIAKCILELFNMSEVEREAMGTRGKVAVMSQFTYKELSKQYLSLIQALIEGSVND